MKKTILICAALLCLNLSGFSQYFASTDSPKRGGGLFGRGLVCDECFYGTTFRYRGLLDNNGLPILPGHDLEDDQPAPVGSGTLLLLGFGAAYALAKKRKENQ